MHSYKWALVSRHIKLPYTWGSRQLTLPFDIFYKVISSKRYVQRKWGSPQIFLETDMSSEDLSDNEGTKKKCL